MQITFTLHHPHHLAPFASQQIDSAVDYFDAGKTLAELNEFVTNSLLPVNERLLASASSLTVQLQISGTTIDLLKTHRPDALGSLKSLVRNKAVSLVAFPYYNSCSAEFSFDEFKAQKEAQAQLLETVFKKSPVPRNDEAIVFDYRCFAHPSKIDLLGQVLHSLAYHQSRNTTLQFEKRSTASFAENRLLQKLFWLEQKVKRSGDTKTIEQWRMLQDVTYYNNRPSLQSSLKNIITDLEIGLIRRQLPKFKRTGNKYAATL